MMIFATSLFLASCSSDDDSSSSNTSLGQYDNGLFVLNEGNSNPSSASLTFIGDNGNVEQDAFTNVNPTAVGLAATENEITLTPWVRDGAAGAGQSLQDAQAAGSTGTIDWGCASATNVKATADGITVVAPTNGLQSKYAPSECR